MKNQRKKQRQVNWLWKIHLSAMVFFAVLFVPTALYWPQNILFLDAISLYALVGQHGTSLQALRAEQREIDSEDDQRGGGQ